MFCRKFSKLLDLNHGPLVSEANPSANWAPTTAHVPSQFCSSYSGYKWKAHFKGDIHTSATLGFSKFRSKHLSGENLAKLIQFINQGTSPRVMNRATDWYPYTAFEIWSKFLNQDNFWNLVLTHFLAKIAEIFGTI